MLELQRPIRTFMDFKGCPQCPFPESLLNKNSVFEFCCSPENWANEAQIVNSFLRILNTRTKRINILFHF